MGARTVAVVGAAGLVGREILAVLETRRFPVKSLRLFSATGGGGRELSFHGERHTTLPLDDRWWEGVDLAFFATEAEVSRRETPRAADQGVTVVDNSSAFRMKRDVPLVVPEVNRGDLKQHRGIVANPNCCTVQLVMALAPLESTIGIRRVWLSTYQSVSGAGASACDALLNETRAALAGREDGERGSGALPHRIAFNLFPQVGDFNDDGWCGEELKLREETRKILHRDDLAVSSTVVRVPVLRGHAESVVVELKRNVTGADVRSLLAEAPGIEVWDDPQSGRYPTPSDVAGSDNVLVGRIRMDHDRPDCVHLWVVGDNLRKGAALNAVQLGEELMRLEAAASAAEEKHSA